MSDTASLIKHLLAICNQVFPFNWELLMRSLYGLYHTIYEFLGNYHVVAGSR